MDLGATICTPRSPSCLICPLARLCKAHLARQPEAFPVKPPRKTRPERGGSAFVAFRPDGSVLMARRPPRGLLGGMLELPASRWDSKVAEAFDPTTALLKPPLVADWSNRPLSIRHVFTHFALELHLKVAHVAQGTAAPEGHLWVQPKDNAVPSLFQKAIAAARPDGMAVGNAAKTGEKRPKSS
jgi:A/G-specific adenine glycosylase